MTGENANSGVNRVSAGLGSDLRAATVGALMPFGAGMLVLLGYQWLDVFGIFLGVGGAVWWAVWWRRKHGAFFPRDVRTGAFIGTIVIAVIAFLLAVAST